MHKMFKNSGVEFGKRSNWLQCEKCGATKHHGFWWLGGYKSKQEPPCEIHPINSKWLNEAEKI